MGLIIILYYIIRGVLSVEVRVTQLPKISLLHTAAVMNPSTECIQKKKRKKADFEPPPFSRRLSANVGSEPPVI